MRTNTTQFEFTNGRKPRGTGLWFFEFVCTKAGKWVVMRASAHGTMAQARKAAWATLVADGCSKCLECVVLP
jgi:hypothetical protein